MGGINNMRKCPVCNCDNMEVVYSVRFSLPVKYRLPDNCNIVRCKHCGMCYSNTSATEDDYMEYYSVCNYYSGVKAKPVWRTKDEIFEKIIANHFSKDAYVSDFGFGDGHLLTYLKSNNYINLVGLDPSTSSVERLNGLGIDGYLTSIYDENESGMLFDVICVMDVFEHLLNPRLAVDKLKTYLRPNGIVVVSVPNYGYLQDNNYFITNMFNQEHINYFSQITLDMIFEQNGYIKEDDFTGTYFSKGEIFASYRLNTKCLSVEDIVDNDTVEEINDYITREDKKEYLIELISQILKEHNKVYLYGNGIFAMWLIANTELQDHIEAIIDINKLKHGLWEYSTGIKIKTVSISDISEEYPILMSVMVSGKKVEEQLKADGIKNEIIQLV